MSAPTRQVTLALLIAVLLGGCAGYSSRPTTVAPSGEMPDATASSVIAEWQRRVAQHVTASGSGDPAVLSQLPGLRSPAVLRPGQIVFAATDVESFVAERDGYDVFGLLVGKRDSTDGPRYVFVVGAVERRNYRSVAVVDLRLAAMSVRSGVVSWETGMPDSTALARYRGSADTSAMVRFPADRDKFRMAACPPGVCVEEIASGARWSIYLDSSVATAPTASPASRP
jgi:hypothetical protein